MITKTLLYFAFLLINYLFLNFSYYDYVWKYVASLLLSLVICWQCAAFTLNYVLRKTYIELLPTTNKVVLVTGCDTGFGNLIALHLNAKGYIVFAGCLCPNNVDILRHKCKNVKLMHPFEMNVTKDEHIKLAYSIIEKFLQENKDAKFWSLINNAGISRPGEIEFGKFEQEFINVFNVNTFSVIKLCRTFLPMIRKYGRNSDSKNNGRIVNINSLAGRCTISPTGSYSMSKHATISLTDALRNELNKFNIKVISIEPYYYKTPQTNEVQLVNALNQCWQNTNETVKSAYGFEYHRNLINLVLDKSFRSTVSHKSNEVAFAVYDAISSTEPEDRYVCACFVMKLLTGLLALLPREWVDVFVKVMQIKFSLNKPMLKPKKVKY